MTKKPLTIKQLLYLRKVHEARLRWINKEIDKMLKKPTAGYDQPFYADKNRLTK